MAGIEVQGVDKWFRPTHALREVTFFASPGQCLGLLGPNGAGKTTLVRILSTIFAPDAGRATVAGWDVVDRPADARRSIGVLGEHPDVYRHLTAEEYLDFFGAIHEIAPVERRRRIAGLLEFFGLAERSSQRLGQFSKGMRQRVCLARTLLHRPPVLLLDEPTSGLDPEASCSLQETIIGLRRQYEMTVMICSHDLSVVAALCDGIAIIDRGRLIEQRSLADLPAGELRRARLEEHYLAVLRESHVQDGPGAGQGAH